MRSSAPWRGCAFESLTTPRSVATESAYRCGETNHDTATIRNIRARVVMAQKYRFSDFCKTDRGRGTGVPAEGLEPTRSCDHWILSPARLPFRHAGASYIIGENCFDNWDSVLEFVLEQGHEKRGNAKKSGQSS